MIGFFTKGIQFVMINRKTLVWTLTGISLFCFGWTLYKVLTGDDLGAVLLLGATFLVSMSSFVISCASSYVYESRSFLIAALLSLVPPVSFVSFFFVAGWVIASRP